jgi:hypothetical protein
MTPARVIESSVDHRSRLNGLNRITWRRGKSRAGNKPGDQQTGDKEFFFHRID